MKPREKSESQHRRDLCEVLRRCWARGYLSGSEGNASIRLGPRRILITPSGVNKGFLGEEDLVIVDVRGEKITGRREATSEMALHLATYAVRPDIGALVHAHPSSAIACSIAGIDLAQAVVPEAVSALGAIPTVPYVTPTTPAVGDAVRATLLRHDAFILERHGTVAVGADIFAAFDKTEILESVARVALLAKAAGNLRTLPPEEVAKILRMTGRYEG